MIFEALDPPGARLKAIRGPMGKGTLKKVSFTKKPRLILKRFWNHVRSLDGIKIALKFECVSERSFERLFTHLVSQREPQRVPREVIFNHFGATSGNVKPMLPLGREHHFEGLRASRVVSDGRLG